MKPNSRFLKEAKQSRTLLLLSILLGLMAGILSIFQAREISRLINQVFLHGAGFDGISGILVIIFLIILLRAGIVWCGDLSSSEAARRIKQGLRQRLHMHLINLGPAYLRGERGEAEVRSGELVNVSTEGIDALEVFYSQYLPPEYFNFRFSS
jgi:ATP-binding cassette subfamily C protein CydD